MRAGYNDPLYTIGTVARLLKTTPATLRIWEKKELLKPARCGKNRYYSECDIDRLEKIKTLLRENRLNIEGVKCVIFTTPCWEIKRCNPKEREVCPVYFKYVTNQACCSKT